MIYPELPTYGRKIEDEELKEMYRDITSWASQLKNLLEIRDIQVDNTPSTTIFSVVTVTSIGRPESGDVAFSIGEGKFKGYVSGTGWVDFN